MTGIRIVAAVTLLTLVTCGCGGAPETTAGPGAAPAGDAEPTAAEILDKVAATYREMETYQSTGTVVADIETAGTQVNQETEFSILLKKPNLYRITWTQKNAAMPGLAQSGAAWSDGTQPYLYMSATNAYSKMPSDEMALGGATGISGGAAYTIPSLFMTVFSNQPAPLARLTDPTLEEAETVGDEDCYVVASSSAVSKRETFWISKSSHKIVKYSRSLEPPEGGRTVPEMAGDKLDESLKAMGQGMTEENKQQMKAMMDKVAETIKNANMKGSSTETHTEISSPDASADDFKFAVPEGAELKESLFGGLLGGMK